MAGLFGLATAGDPLFSRLDGEVEGVVALEGQQPLERQLVPAAGVLEELNLDRLDRHPVDVSQPLDRVQDRFGYPGAISLIRTRLLGCHSSNSSRTSTNSTII